jgi:hypothetical protein
VNYYSLVGNGYNHAPPRCSKHDEQMILYFYARPGGPDGNNWSCRSCTRQREEQAQAQKTRFPEGAEL